jgi:hypothetical protein
MRKLMLYGAIIIAVSVAGSLVYLNNSGTPFTLRPGQFNQLPAIDSMIFQRVNTYDKCVAATNLIYTSYPSKCFGPAGQVFANPIDDSQE